MLKRLLGPTNRRIRLCVGLMLVGLFCIQCIGPNNEKVIDYAVAVDNPDNPRQATEKARKLAETDHIACLEYCLAHYRYNYTSYRCTFIKQERIAGRVGKEQEIAIKFRGKPFSVAMAWQKNPPMGDRVLYIEGKYGNQMLVRPAGAIARMLAGDTVLRKPDSPDARRSTLRTVNLFGFERCMESLIKVYKQAKENGDLKEKLEQDADVKGRMTFVLARYLPGGKGYPGRKTLIYIDQEYLVPIMIEGFGPNDKFLCRYFYGNIDFDAELTDKDFVPENNDLLTPKQ